MINEEKVKQLYRLAEYDRKYGEKDRPMGRYFRKDYIIREMIKSFFAGTAVYILFLVLCVLNQANEILNSMNNTDFLRMAVVIGLCYVAFLAVYLLITYLVYYVRYTNGRKRLKKYYERLYRINRSEEKKESDG